jgi:hypothetical protein
MQTPAAGWAETPAGAPVAAAPESAGAWLPAVEDLEEPDRLEEPDGGGRGGAALVQFTARRGAEPVMRRVAARVVWRADGPGVRGLLEASAIDSGGRLRPAGIARVGSWEAGAGRVAVREAPSLLARRAGLARDGSRIPEARATTPRVEPPRGASAFVHEGFVLARRGSRFGAWLLEGRRPEWRGRLALGGLSWAAREWRVALAAGRSGADALATGAVRWQGRRAAAAGEILAARDRVEVLASAETRREPLTLRARWRDAAGDGRPAALETAATIRGRAGTVRLAWRAWSLAAPDDDGSLEVEASTALGSGRPLRARWVTRPGSQEGPAAVERYGIVDATLVRDGARSLALLASLRRGSDGGATARSVGGRLRLGEGGVSRVEVLAQAFRSRSGAPALGATLHASGEATLAERVRSGLALAARAVARRGPVELGCVLEGDEGAGGARSGSVSIWLRFFHRSPSGSGRGAAGPLP